MLYIQNPQDRGPASGISIVTMQCSLYITSCVISMHNNRPHASLRVLSQRWDKPKGIQGLLRGSTGEDAAHGTRVVLVNL